MIYLTKAINLVGGQSQMASMLGTRQGVVWRWLDRGQAPAKYIRKISLLTGGEVTVEQLLQDHEKEQ